MRRPTGCSPVPCGDPGNCSMNLLKTTVMKYMGIKRFFLSLMILAWIVPARTLAQEENPILKDLEKVLVTVSGFEPDQTRAWHREYLELMAQVYQDPVLKKEAEKRMVRALEAGASGTGSRLICRELGVIGSDYSVPLLSELLEDPGMTDVALLALENIPGDRSGTVLREALSKGDAAAKIRIINSLAVRKDLESVKQLEELTLSSDQEVGQAAIRALGQIGGEEAAGILEEQFEETGGELRWTVADAWLICADGFLSGGRKKEAEQIYRNLFEADPPLSLRNASLKGWFLTSGEPPAGFLAGHLRGDDSEYHRRVINLIGLIPDPEGLAALYEEVPGLPELSKLYLMNVLAAAGDYSVRPLIMEMLKDEDQLVRISAIKAFPGVGKSEDAVLLAAIAASTRGVERDMARQSLYKLSAPGTGDKIWNAITSAEGREKAELVRAAGERNMTGAIDLVIRSASDPDHVVRQEAIRALGRMGSPEILPEVITLLVEAESSRERREAEQAVLALLRKMPVGTGRSSGIIDALNHHSEPSSAASLLSILGQLGEPEGLPVLRKALGSGEDEIRLAAIRAFSAWPDAAPLPDLMEILTTTSDQREHTLALRGSVDLVTRDAHLSGEEKLEEMNRIWENGGNEGEKKTVISGLSKIRSIGALDMAMELVRLGESRPEAETAVITIAQGTGYDDPEATRIRLTEFLSLSKDPDHIGDAKRILERINQ